LTLLVDETFETGDLSAWLLGAGWSGVPSALLTTTDAPLSLVQTLPSEVAVET
jgi:hypothetical protein